jgi:lysophospholipase L1-like esterase
MPTYLALGDSMSIDDYTGVPEGGATHQFYRWLGKQWILDDRTRDGCLIEEVPRNGRGDVITLTIGGNDLLVHRDEYLTQGLDRLEAEHLELLTSVRAANPAAVFIVGDVYAPQFPLSSWEQEALASANLAIRKNCATVGAQLARIHQAFRGHESQYLCLAIEPTFKGARVIFALFRDAFERATREPSA